MKAILRSKKGVEQPQVVVYVLFVVVLTLAGIYIAFIQLGAVDIAFKFQDYNTRLNVVAARLMFNPECYAVEEPYYSKSGAYYQVSGGIIDWNKFGGKFIIDNACISGENQVYVFLKEIDNKYNNTLWSCPDIVPFCGKPTEEQLKREWDPSERSYVVLISKDGKLDLGVMTVRLKE